MKKILLLIVFMLFIGKVNSQITKKNIYRSTTLTANEKACVFGDNVKLRSNPNTGSKVIQLLSIASEIEILEKLATTYSYNGIDWPWYKVKFKNTEGYIIGGLIALDTQRIRNSVYLVSLKKEKDAYKIITRLVHGEEDYIEHIHQFGTDAAFTFEASDNRGINTINTMVFINYQADACGVNGGGYYLFDNGKTLTKALDLYEMSEAGMFNFTEDVIFPNEEGGKENKIYFKRTSTSYIDESNNRVKTVIESCEFNWEGTLLKLEEIKE